MAERAFLEKVGGDCKVPAGIYAVPFLGHIEAAAFIGSPDGKEMYKRSLNGQTQDAKQLGESLAEALIADGGGRILEGIEKMIDEEKTDEEGKGILNRSRSGRSRTFYAERETLS